MEEREGTRKSFKKVVTRAALQARLLTSTNKAYWMSKLHAARALIADECDRLWSSWCAISRESCTRASLKRAASICFFPSRILCDSRDFSHIWPQACDKRRGMILGAVWSAAE